MTLQNPCISIDGGEGEGAHTQLPYDWQAGRWYRMLLQCGTSKTTGNTTVEQWFQDLTTGKWTHTCTYDTGVKNSCFTGNAAFFSENFLPQYAGEVRSLEVANVRIHTVSDGQWRDVTGVQSIGHNTANPKAYGSWQAGADANSFYMITTGVTGLPGRESWGSTASLTVQNRESGDPLAEIPTQKPIRFTDVASDAYYAEPVAWAVEKGITSGTNTSSTTFSPNSYCTHAQILTFLWRASGCPDPDSAAPGFLTGTEYYADAVSWASSKNMLSSRFDPGARCTRAQAVRYIWQVRDGHYHNGSSLPFTDLGSYYDLSEFAWAVENGVTNGTSRTTFGPNDFCTRGQIVTFLHRAFVQSARLTS